MVPAGHPLRLTPISLPIPKVMAAADRPKSTWRKPDQSTERAVKRVVPAPMTNSPIPLTARLIEMPGVPARKINGRTGMMAPTANSRNEARASR
jgi:hypothetical protein